MHFGNLTNNLIRSSWVEHVAPMGKITNACTVLAGKPEETNHLRNIDMNRRMRYDGS